MWLERGVIDHADDGRTFDGSVRKDEALEQVVCCTTNWRSV
jgi:hypothetical protein